MRLFSGWHGRQKVPRGVDYKRGAKEYLNKVDKDTYYYHFVKPYVGGPDFSSYLQEMRDFLALFEILDLAPRSRVLEVGCGPGWICERLAMFGHQVCGIDLSPGMIEIARQRLAAIKYGPFEHTLPEVDYRVADAERFQLGRTFDAAVYFSTLHHIEDAPSSLRCAFEHLTEHGKLFIVEGVKPPEGSVWDQENLRLMRDLATLESPFEPDHLAELVTRAGFTTIRQFRMLNKLCELGFEEMEQAAVAAELAAPLTKNALLARKPIPGLHYSDNPGRLLAEFSSPETALRAGRGEPIVLRVNVRNSGDTLWLRIRPKRGWVRLRARLRDENGGLLRELFPAVMLNHDMMPDERFEVTMSLDNNLAHGRYLLEVDMVNEGITWFSDQGNQGSRPLRLPLTIG
ncbi:class I SAM-dependent methyltransferase [bacterium]|nr:class I SAM-dependent methyltransferase [candidate division CSSED10-310 bacterium]